MARNALDKMKKQGSAKAKQNRTERRTESAKQYNRSQNSSDKAYIEGNYKKVASNKVYGYKQSLKKGEIVKGEDTDWLRDDKIYRNTKVKENTSWKNPTNNNGKQKYAILSSHKWDKAKKFDDHFNTKVRDGRDVAKANHRKGKYISNKIEDLKGFAKDFVVDPAVDFMKGVGAIGSYGVAGIAGFAEDSGNVFKAIADPKRDYKYYSQGRSNIKENLKMNKESLNETGFGESFSTYLKGAKQRGEEEHIRLLEEQGRHNEVREYKKQIEKNKKRDEILTNVAGFGMDILAPTPVEDGIGKVIGKLGKNTVESFKQLKNGTASLATGILPEETAKLMSNSKRYAGKGVSGASDDVFFSGKKGSTSIDKKLDNEFSKVMDNVKDVVKKNPTTPNLGKFLDVMDGKPLKGTQRNIDGRTLNKKYTQTKDGYKPNLMNNFDEIDDVVKEFAQSQQFSMFGKNGSTEGYLKQLKDPYARYENILEKYNGDIDGLAEKLDSMKPQNAKEMYDYLMKRKPNLYKELTKGSDDVTNLMIKNDKYNLRNISDELSSIDKIKELNKGYNQLNERRLLESINGKQEKIGARLKVSKGKQIFKDVVGEYLFGKLPNKSVDELEHVSGLFNNMINMLDNKEQTHVIAKQLNALLFDGQDVIRNNMPRSSMKDMVEYFDDIVNYQKAVGNGEMSVKFRHRDLPKEYNIYAKDGNMNLTKDIDFSAKFSPSAVDSSFETKRQDIASRLGVKYKTDITKPYDEYLARKMNGEILTEQEYRHFKDLESRKNTWDKLYKQVADLDPKEYEEFARKNFGKNKGYNDALEELAEKQARIDATKGRENVLKEAKRNLELGSDPSVTASPRSQNLLHNGDVGEWEQMTKGNTTGNIKNIPFKEYKQNYSKELGLNYVNTKYPIQIRKEKQTLQGVRSYKPVDTAITNLEKLMNKEVALTIKGNVNAREYETLRTLVKENVQRLEELGVSKNTYFNHIKQLKMNLLKDGQVSKNLSGVKPMSGKVKNTTKGMNPLEMAHIKINGKALDNIEELTPDQLQWKYLMTEGAKTIDELFDAMPGSIPQRGDNIGDEIGSMLRPNKVENTPLDNIPNKTDDFVDSFEAFNARLNEEESKLIRKQIENKPEKIKKTYDKEQLQKEINLIDETYGKRDVKVYDNASDFLGETFPGVDEDGVITPLKAMSEKLDTKPFEHKESPFKQRHIDEHNNGKSKTLPTFDQFKEVLSKNKIDYKDNEIYDMYKAWLNSWKKGLTVYNPGWHVQNFFQNKGQNYLAFGADALLPQTDARNILKQINGKKAKDVNIFDKKNMKSYSSDEISKLAQELGVIDSLGEDVLNARGIFPRLENKVDNSRLMKWLGQNEQTARLNHFIKQIERGMSPEDASKSVNKYLFDYSKKNGVDDFVGDFIDPFWTFHKNNARLLYGSMYEHPGKINNIIRGTEGLENGIPEEQRQNEEYKYGKLQLPHANFTDSVNKDQYNYLYSENMFPDVEDAIPFEQDAIENKMNPLLRIALQQARGEGNFGKKIVEKGEEAGWNEITMGQRLGEVVLDLNPFMPNLVDTYFKTRERQEKADEGEQSQETSDVQILMDWINYITGNKGNFYRNVNF